MERYSVRLINTQQTFSLSFALELSANELHIATIALRDAANYYRKLAADDATGYYAQCAKEASNLYEKLRAEHYDALHPEAQ